MTEAHYSLALLAAVILASLATIMLKTIPITFLKADSLPPLFRRWLGFVPVAVMAALVGPDIFVVNGSLDLSFSNLFLLVSIPTLLVAWLTTNYFFTIAFGIGLIIICRYFGF